MLPFLACSPVGTKASGRNEKPEGAVISYEYQLSGTVIHPLLYYQVERDPAGTVCIAWSKDCDPEIRVIRGPEDFFDRLGDLFDKYRLYRLRIRYLPRMTILDGEMWRTYIRFEQGSVSSGGSNAFPPEKLQAGISAINGYIRSLIEASSEEDVIGRRSHDDR
ncbi:MAG: hypothetical protein K5849_04780 [Bacteroidales bacterium]|nr:hypothetical protein [Bacteroidales bacterium]